jgi:hypothetical protein
VTTSAKYSLTHYVEGQTQAAPTINAAINGLDTLSQLTVKSLGDTAPPGSPVDGDAYILGSGPTGDWSSFSADDIAYYYGGSWTAVTPWEGALAFVQDEDRAYRHITAWEVQEIYAFPLTVRNSGGIGASEEAQIAIAPIPLEVVQVEHVRVGGTSIDWMLRRNTSRAAAGTNMFSTNRSTTSSTTAQQETTFSVSGVPASSHIWWLAQSVSGTVTELHLTVKAVRSF